MSNNEHIRQRINETRRGSPSETGNALDDVLGVIETVAEQTAGGPGYPIGTTAGTVAAGDHNHDAQYASLTHNHNGNYSLITHNHDIRYALTTHYHDETYSPISHNHDSYYISVIAAPTAGNFPIIESSGELANGSYGPSSFSLSNHNHDSNYALQTTSIVGTASITGGGDLSSNKLLSLVGDIASPGANQVYGTDGTGLRVWKADPAGGGGTTTIIDGTGMLGVDSMTALRAVTGQVDNQAIYLKGYNAPSDGGEGVFVWDADYDPQMVATVAISAAGTGYKVGTLVTINATADVNTAANKRAAVRIVTVNGSGGVTGIDIVRWGLYTTTTQSSSVPTSSPVGTGLTVNLTFVNADDQGTFISPTGSVDAGRWIRSFSGPTNILWYGVIEGTNSRPKIQLAVSCYEQVYFPTGRWSVHDPICLFQSSRITGAGTYQTIIIGSPENIGKPIFFTNPVRVGIETTSVNDTKSVEIRNLAIHGYCTSAIHLVEGTGSSIENVRIYNLYNTSHAFVCEDCWNTKIRNITFTAVGTDIVAGYTPPSDLACLWIGRFANAFTLDSIISSSTNDYGILVECTVGTGSAQWFRDLCLQGHGKIAMWIKDNGTGPTIIDGFFTEACKQSLRLGETTTNRSARSVSLRGAHFQGSTATQLGLATVFVDLAYGFDVTAGIFGAGDNLDDCIFLFNDCHQARFTSNYLGFQPITDVIRRSEANSRPDIQCFDMEMTGGSTMHTVLLMKAASTTHGRMVRMWVDGTGAWQNSLLTIPVHSAL